MCLTLVFCFLCASSACPYVQKVTCIANQSIERGIAFGFPEPIRVAWALAHLPAETQGVFLLFAFRRGHVYGEILEAAKKHAPTLPLSIAALFICGAFAGVSSFLAVWRRLDRDEFQLRSLVPLAGNQAIGRSWS